MFHEYWHSCGRVMNAYVYPIFAIYLSLLPFYNRKCLTHLNVQHKLASSNKVSNN